MKQTMLYTVTFDTEHRAARQTKHYIYHCFAQNAAAAKDACKAAWLKHFSVYTSPRIPHQFHMSAKRAENQNVDLLRVTTWRETVINGGDCVDRIVCTDWKSWPRRI